MTTNAAVNCVPDEWGGGVTTEWMAEEYGLEPEAFRQVLVNLGAFETDADIPDVWSRSDRWLTEMRFLWPNGLFSVRRYNGVMIKQEDDLYLYMTNAYDPASEQHPHNVCETLSDGKKFAHTVGFIARLVSREEAYDVIPQAVRAKTKGDMRLYHVGEEGVVRIISLCASR